MGIKAGWGIEAGGGIKAGDGHQGRGASKGQAGLGIKAGWGIEGRIGHRGRIGHHGRMGHQAGGRGSWAQGRRGIGRRGIEAGGIAGRASRMGINGGGITWASRPTGIKAGCGYGNLRGIVFATRRLADLWVIAKDKPENLISGSCGLIRLWLRKKNEGADDLSPLMAAFCGRSYRLRFQLAMAGNHREQNGVGKADRFPSSAREYAAAPAFDVGYPAKACACHADDGRRRSFCASRSQRWKRLCAKRGAYSIRWRIPVRRRQACRTERACFLVSGAQWSAMAMLKVQRGAA